MILRGAPSFNNDGSGQGASAEGRSFKTLVLASMLVGKSKELQPLLRSRPKVKPEAFFAWAAAGGSWGTWSKRWWPLPLARSWSQRTRRCGKLASCSWCHSPLDREIDGQGGQGQSVPPSGPR